MEGYKPIGNIPNVSHLTGNTLVRLFKAPGVSKPMVWSELQLVDPESYAANHFNDSFRAVCLFLSRITGFYHVAECFSPEWLKTDSPNIEIKTKEVKEVGPFIYQQLAHAQGTRAHVIAISVIYDGQENAITFREAADCIEVGFCNESVLFIDGMTFEKMEDKLKPYGLKTFAANLSRSNTLPAIRVPIVQETYQSNPYIDRQECQYPFVSIHAGMACSATRDTVLFNHTATTVLHKRMFAATVVEGWSPMATPEYTQAYSALITSVALDTVKFGALEQKLTDADLQAYFYMTLKLLEASDALGENILQQGHGVMFAGVVAYVDPDGTRRMFVYGLGCNAVAVTSAETDITLHLQGNFARNSESAEIRPAALGVNHQHVQATHVTAKIFPVYAHTLSIQIMTQGCASAFFDSTFKTAATYDQPATHVCQNLPKDGKLDPDDFLDKVAKDTVRSSKVSDALHLSIDTKDVFSTLERKDNFI